MYCNEGGSDFVAAVLDGHGEAGHHVSKFVREQLAPELLSCYSTLSDVDGSAEVVRGAFGKVANKLAQVCDWVSLCASLRQFQPIFVTGRLPCFQHRLPGPVWPRRRIHFRIHTMEGERQESCCSTECGK
jgi:hypothetical protein